MSRAGDDSTVGSGDVTRTISASEEINKGFAVGLPGNEVSLRG